MEAPSNRCRLFSLLFRSLIAAWLTAVVVEPTWPADENPNERHPSGMDDPLPFKLKQRINLVRDHFSILESAISRYMEKNNGNPPENLHQLVPNYLPALPTDPFRATQCEFGRSLKHLEPSSDHHHYLYRRRPAPMIVVSWTEPIKWIHLDGSWELASVGFADRPFYSHSKYRQALVRTYGYWGRMILDVF